ncbi:hypothetical protein SK128_017864 [Halocaridina rubra]|uniref:Uncharacterized protein n=1 Tax=Halocaridina rubra TaxID=373956 RepID=A0AAN8WMV3_HALRR
MSHALRTTVLILGILCMLLWLCAGLSLWSFCLYREFALDLVFGMIIIILGYAYTGCQIMSFVMDPNLETPLGLRTLRKYNGQLLFLIIVNVGFCIGTCSYILPKQWLYWAYAPEVLVTSTFVFLPTTLLAILTWSLQRKILKNITKNAQEMEKERKMAHGGFINPAFYGDANYDMGGFHTGAYRRFSVPEHQTSNYMYNGAHYILPTPYKISRPKTYFTNGANVITTHL